MERQTEQAVIDASRKRAVFFTTYFRAVGQLMLQLRKTIGQHYCDHFYVLDTHAPSEA